MLSNQEAHRSSTTGTFTRWWFAVGTVISVGSERVEVA